MQKQSHAVNACIKQKKDFKSVTLLYTLRNLPIPTSYLHLKKNLLNQKLSEGRNKLNPKQQKERDKETNKIEKRKIIINEIKRWYFEKITKLTTLKQMKMRILITKIKYESGDILLTFQR